MGMRPGRTIKAIERPWTRVSIRVPKKGYVRGVPQIKLHQFNMGTMEGDYDTTLYMIAKHAVQLREQSIEAGRIVAQNFLEKKIGLENYSLKILVYPHQILREKPIATGAGADRYSQGMAAAFGQTVGSAVQTRVGQKLVVMKTKKVYVETAKQALRKMSLKISIPVRILVE
jgi:large subunit ribosomal protein L10e